MMVLQSQTLGAAQAAVLFSATSWCGAEREHLRRPPAYAPSELLITGVFS